MLRESRFRLTGISALLHNRYDGQPAPRDFASLTPQEAWAYAVDRAYLSDGKPVIPSTNLQQALIAAGAFLKGKGRGNLSRLVAACVQIRETELPVAGPEPSLHRAMRRNPATGGRMLNYRLMVSPPWTSEGTITWDDDLLTRAQVGEVLETAGIRVGIMDWRPQRKGSFGQFSAELL